MRESFLQIEKLTFGGAGIGRLSGKACFVPYTAPDEEVHVRIVKEKQSYCEAEVRSMVRPSPHRVAPTCPVFGQCGGCSWQHVVYSEQCHQKQQLFADALWRGARIDAELIEPLMPAPESFHYRSRIQLKLRMACDRVHMGFYRSGTHYVIDVPTGCAIASPILNTAIDELRACITDSPEPDRIPQIDLATGSRGGVSAVIHYAGDSPDPVARWFQAHRELFPTLIGAQIQTGRKSTLSAVFGETRLDYEVPGRLSGPLRLSFLADGFAQVNYRQNASLIDKVMQWGALTGTERVLDLFCGNGNLSLPLATAACHVVGIESYQASIEEARRNASANNIENVSFICADTLHGLQELTRAGERFDLVLLDPPRTGALETVGLIVALAPERIIYVSCDPATLARDLSKFDKSGYRVVKSCPVDMFPQTFHLESVTLLARTN